MRLSELSQEILETIKTYRWDRIIEKHEGPETWESTLKYDHPEILEIEGHQVLLPVDRSRHPNITILRCIRSEDGQFLTIFLQDTTYDEGIFAGFVAVCENIPETALFLAILYHEWFIIEEQITEESSNV